jgi:hypothetical protein
MKRIFDAIIATIWWFCTLPSRYDVERRSSAKYKKKKQIVKNIWIVAGVFIVALLQYPVFAALAFLIALATTFLCFMILDETE